MEYWGVTAWKLIRGRGSGTGRLWRSPWEECPKAASRLRRWVLILQQIHGQPASNTEYPCPQPALTRAGRRPCCSAQTANNLERIRFPIFNRFSLPNLPGFTNACTWVGGR